MNIFTVLSTSFLKGRTKCQPGRELPVRTNQAPGPGFCKRFLVHRGNLSAPFPAQELPSLPTESRRVPLNQGSLSFLFGTNVVKLFFLNSRFIWRLLSACCCHDNCNPGPQYPNRLPQWCFLIYFPPQINWGVVLFLGAPGWELASRNQAGPSPPGFL